MKPAIAIWPRWPRVEDLLKISEGTDANQRNTSDRRRNGTGDNPLQTRRAGDHADITLKISPNDEDRDVKKGHSVLREKLAGVQPLASYINITFVRLD